MILVDTSVWIEFFRGNPRTEGLAELMQQFHALLHPWIRGELELGGHFGKRSGYLFERLTALPEPAVLGDDAIFAFIGGRSLAGRGIGWVDAAFLASALVSKSRVWSFDRSLNDVARELGVPLHS